jgi:predicted AAA+ superfamily ATPase
MKRQSIEYLQKWFSRSDRKPLLLRGARQVGKTWLVRETARILGLNLVEVNFELRPEAKTAFQSLQPADILKALSFLGFGPVEPGSSLLLLDEIQECPQAISALRYFYETRPDLAVIGTGSLLEFALEAEHFSMPVGRVEYMWLYPMNFIEYLLAKGHTTLADAISSFNPAHNNWTELIHKQALTHLRNYLFCGGMPQALKAMAENDDIDECRRAQLSILQSYRQDFYKYAGKINASIAEQLFLRAPGLVGGRLKFTHIVQEARSSEVKPAVIALEKAGVIRRVFHSSGQGLPLATDCNERISKLFMVDVGLMHAALQIDAQLVQEPDLLAIHRGAVAEQFVAQELLSSTPQERESELYFWVREANNSQSEVDFLVPVNGKVLPIEVKSGTAGTLKSLQIFLNSHPGSTRGIRLFTGMPMPTEKILHLPLYLAGKVLSL